MCYEERVEVDSIPCGGGAEKWNAREPITVLYRGSTNRRVPDDRRLMMLRRGLPPMTVFLKNEYGEEKTDQEIDDAYQECKLLQNSN